MILSCCICLKNADELKTLNSEDKSQIKLSTKLTYIAPEYEWLGTFLICPKCIIQLDSAYQFKQLCFTNDSFRKEFNQHTVSSFDEDNNGSDELIEVKALSDHEENETKLITYDQAIIKEQPEDDQKFTCYHCNKNVKSKSILESHIIMKHRNICEACGSNFGTKKKLQFHKKNEHQAKLPAKFQCELCGEDFFLLKNILEHCTSVHNMNRKDIKPYRCDQCSNKFNSSSLLIQHKKYHNGDRTFVCSTCGKSYITRRDLNGHEKLHDNQRKYTCSKCDKSFNTSQNLKTHIYVVHTDSAQWKYSCPVCSKRFAMKANFNEHIKRHQGSKDFVCHICKKTFVSNHEVKKHVKLHSNIAPFKCSLCQKPYRDKRCLDAHLSKMHGIAAPKLSVRIKRFVCHICPSQFFDNSKLQRHIRTHTGVKPFCCYECDKRFIDKSYLTHHLKTVHNIVGPMKTSCNISHINLIFPKHST